MHISQFFCIFARLFGKKYDKTMFTPINAHIEIDRVLKRARKDGKDIHLTSLEFGLLEYLCSHPNKLCSRDELIDQVWGERFLYDPGTIDVHLNALRRKMGFDKKKSHRDRPRTRTDLPYGAPSDTLYHRPQRLLNHLARQP